ncbi:hypothetical protein MRX96_049845 [Rhipicephalus microplus]
MTRAYKTFPVRARSGIYSRRAAQHQPRNFYAVCCEGGRRDCRASTAAEHAPLPTYNARSQGQRIGARSETRRSCHGDDDAAMAAPSGGPRSTTRASRWRAGRRRLAGATRAGSCGISRAAPQHTATAAPCRRRGRRVHHTPWALSKEPARRRDALPTRVDRFFGRRARVCVLLGRRYL